MLNGYKKMLRKDFIRCRYSRYMMIYDDTCLRECVLFDNVSGTSQANPSRTLSAFSAPFAWVSPCGFAIQNQGTCDRTKL